MLMSLDIEDLVTTGRTPSEAQGYKLQRRSTRKLKLFDPKLVKMASRRSFLMLNPASMARNPVMFLVEIGWVLTSVVVVQSLINHEATGLIVYQIALSLLLLLTVLFANFAEALAEARGKAQADSLRQTRADTPALKLDSPDSLEGQMVSSTKLRAGDHVAIEAGQVIPTDGEVVRRVAAVDESAITGESAPVIREALPDGQVLRHHARHPHTHCFAGMLDPHHHWRVAGGDRDRGDGPGVGGEHHCQERQSGRGRR
jgi:K+-transporting ATPase ATPase B chain